MKKTYKIIFVCIFITIVLLTILNIKPKNSRQDKVIRVLYTADLTGAPILVMQKLDLIKKYDSAIRLSVNATSPGSAINEAIIAKQADIGHLGIPNILIGIDKGIPYKIMTSVSNTEGGIQTNNPDIKSLKDIKPTDKISIPNLTGTSAMQLHILALKELGDYDALKNNLIVMSDDNAVISLINKSGITLHMTQFTYRIKENDAGLKTIINSSNISSEIIMEKYCVATKEFYTNNRDLYNAFYSALKDAIDLINEKDERALSIMQEEYEFDKDTLVSYLDNGYITYSYDNNNMEPYIDIAYKMGLISSKKTVNELFFKNK